MPFALSVRSPAAVPGYPYTDAIRSQTDFDREQTRFRGLQNELRTRFHCSLETCAWSPNFTVIVMQDRALSEVKSLILDAGALLEKGDVHELDLEEQIVSPDGVPDSQLPPFLRRNENGRQIGGWKVRPRHIEEKALPEIFVS